MIQRSAAALTARELEPLPSIPPITTSLAGILAHEAASDGIASVVTVDGESIFVAVGPVEIGPDWLLIRTGHGEGRHAAIVPFSAVSSVKLR